MARKSLKMENNLQLTHPLTLIKKYNLEESMKDKIIFMAVVLFFNISIFSNEPEIGECRIIEDPSARLGCYDSFFQLDTNKPSIVQGNSSSSSIKNIQKKYSPSKEINLTPLTIKKEAESIDQVKQFGLPKKENKKPMMVQAKITKIKKLGSYKLDIYLDNGQVWRTVESIYRVKIKKSQEVSITKAAISGYIMKIVDKKIALRVNRVK